jgi:hypothetical protein
VFNSATRFKLAVVDCNLDCCYCDMLGLPWTCMQVFMFLAIEPPASLTGPDITQAKVDLLRAVKTLDLSDGVYLGQFSANSWIVGGE